MALKFRSAAGVESIVWQMRLADYPRSLNRARINALMNGAPPISPQEAEINNWGTNVNFLEGTMIDHSARRQVWNALCVPSPIFTVDVDYGPVWKRQAWSQIITTEINKPLMSSQEYLELRDGVGASMILHGVGPAIWEDEEKWCPTEVGIEDVLIPSNTLRSLKNLPFFAVYRQYTAPTFYKMTHGPHVDPAWNMPMVEQCLEWIDQQSRMLLGQNWPEVWSPEKMEERFKQDSGLYASDAVPTIDCYDFYFWNDTGEESGWCRRMILDAWGQPGVGGTMGIGFDTQGASPLNRRFDFSKGNFLYNSEDRVVQDKLSKIIHFQFGDASAVAPFRYHSVRSLGFLLYAVCHLQNRLKCRFSDAAFESMMQYFRINNPADMDRLQKIDLSDKGIIPEGLQFVKREERWEINEALAMQAMQLNRQSMSDVSSTFNQEYEQPDKGEETATAVMAKVNSAAALVGSMVNHVYAQEKFRQIEICRRFCIQDSKDKDVRKFRVEVLKQGVPEEALNSDCWTVKPTRVVGGGDKMMQVAIADKLMAVRQAHGPEAQTKILRFYDAVITDNYEMAIDLNPETPHVSDSVHDTQLAFGSMMAGSIVTPKPGLNALEVASTMIQLMSVKVQQMMQMGGVGTPQEILGLQICAQYTSAYIEQLAQDPEQKAVVKEMGDALGNIGNQVKAMAQRQQEMMQQQQQQNGADPKHAADAQATIIKAQMDAKIREDSAAQRTAQKKIQFEQKFDQQRQQHEADLIEQQQRTQAEIQLETAKTLTELRKQMLLTENKANNSQTENG